MKDKTRKQREYRQRRYKRDPHFLQLSLERLRKYKPPVHSPSPSPTSVTLRSSNMTETAAAAAPSYVVMDAPFSMIVSGPSMSGKTEFVCKLLENRRDMIKPEPAHIWWFHGQTQEFHDDLQRRVGSSSISLIERFPTLEDVQLFNKDPTTPKVLVLDDLISDVSGSGKEKNAKRDILDNLFFKVAHHTNTSVIFITQTLYRNSALKNITESANYVVLFAGSMAVDQARKLSQKQYSKAYYLVDIMENPRIEGVSKDSHFYLFIDMRVNNIKDHNAIPWRYNIFPDDKPKYGWQVR